MTGSLDVKSDGTAVMKEEDGVDFQVCVHVFMIMYLYVLFITYRHLVMYVVSRTALISRRMCML